MGKGSKIIALPGMAARRRRRLNAEIDAAAAADDIGESPTEREDETAFEERIARIMMNQPLHAAALSDSELISEVSRRFELPSDRGRLRKLLDTVANGSIAHRAASKAAQASCDRVVGIIAANKGESDAEFGHALRDGLLAGQRARNARIRSLREISCIKDKELVKEILRFACADNDLATIFEVISKAINKPRSVSPKRRTQHA